MGSPELTQQLHLCGRRVTCTAASQLVKGLKRHLYFRIAESAGTGFSWNGSHSRVQIAAIFDGWKSDGELSSVDRNDSERYRSLGTRGGSS